MDKCEKCHAISIKINNGYLYHDIFECLSCGFARFKRTQECCRDSFSIVVADHKSYPPILRKQCRHCGFAEMTKPLSRKLFHNDIRGEFNLAAFEERKVNATSEGQMIYEFLSSLNFQLTSYYKYQKYLMSQAWRDKRKLVLERDDNLCQSCKIKPAEEVHHLTYNNLFNEPLEDLQSLCKSCHKAVHQTTCSPIN